MTINKIATLISAPGGYAWQLADVSGLHRDNGASQPGDVLSIQPDGSAQTRASDAIGAWEILTIQGPYFVYAGAGKTVLILPPGL